MVLIHLATDQGLRIAEWSPEGDGTDRPLSFSRHLANIDVRSLRVLPGGSPLCGGKEPGLWIREPVGGWTRVVPSPESPRLRVTALEAGARHRHSGRPVLWAGTEPSRVFRSEDGGRQWSPTVSLDDLPSSGEWSYPPRPDTHHVRCLAAHPRDADTLLAGIEAGAVVATRDGGASWADRTPQGPRDPHRMRVHPVDPDRVLVAAGNGFAESWDFGRCWSWTGDGMEVTYVWDVAIESSEGRNALASASPDARRAHDTGRCESRIYRRDLAPDTPESRDSLPRWRDVSPVSPPVDRRRAPVLSPVPGWPDSYLLCTRRGEMAWTPDAGNRWLPLPADTDDVADVREVTVVPGE